MAWMRKRGNLYHRANYYNGPHEVCGHKFMRAREGKVCKKPAGHGRHMLGWSDSYGHAVYHTPAYCCECGYRGSRRDEFRKHIKWSGRLWMFEGLRQATLDEVKFAQFIKQASEYCETHLPLLTQEVVA